MEKRVQVHMQGGDGATSYANNSGLQRVVISKTWSILDRTLKCMFAKQGSSTCLRIVDMGCASGPNTLLAISHMMETINDLYKNEKVDTPEYEVYLNDLHNNDFNTLFKMLPSFEQEWENCCLFGLPRSFHGRLFPSESLHFAYSCYGLQWLSKIPDGVGKSNEKNIHITRSSSEEVFLAYKKQYHMDFSRFLSHRGEEMVAGGHMVLAFIGRSNENRLSKDMCGGIFTLLTGILSEMAYEALINMDDLLSFNVPQYFPSREEVKAIIKQEGSFNLDMMDVFEVPMDADGRERSTDRRIFDMYKSGRLAASCVRAFMEPMWAHHFRNAIDVNDLFERFARKAARHIAEQNPSYFTIAISLSKKR